jgi:hypothetical protein
MNLVDLPTELIIAIADNLRTEAEKKPSVASCRDFVRFSQASRYFCNVAETSLKPAYPETNRDLKPKGLLTKAQTNHITKELRINHATQKHKRGMAKAWLKTVTPISMWARRVGNICWFCPNRARHSLYGEAFTGLGMCQVCEAILFPKMSFETLENLLGFDFDANTLPYDNPESWRAYPHCAESDSFEFNQPSWPNDGPYWLLPTGFAWEIRTRTAKSDNRQEKKAVYNLDKFTTWSHAKALLNKGKYQLWSKYDPLVYGEEFSFFQGRHTNRWWPRSENLKSQTEYMNKRESSWWSFRFYQLCRQQLAENELLHCQYPRQEKAAYFESRYNELLHCHYPRQEKAAYFEFRYRFDPWWHDNKIPSQMHHEYIMVESAWRDVDARPWDWSQFPTLPPCSRIRFGEPGEDQQNRDQAKLEEYNHHCAALRQFFWNNPDVIKHPRMYWEAISKQPPEINCWITKPPRILNPLDRYFRKRREFVSGSSFDLGNFR